MAKWKSDTWPEKEKKKKKQNTTTTKTKQNKKNKNQKANKQINELGSVYKEVG